MKRLVFLKIRLLASFTAAFVGCLHAQVYAAETKLTCSNDRDWAHHFTLDPDDSYKLRWASESESEPRHYGKDLIEDNVVYSCADGENGKARCIQINRVDGQFHYIEGHLYIDGAPKRHVFKNDYAVTGTAGKCVVGSALAF